MVGEDLQQAYSHSYPTPSSTSFQSNNRFSRFPALMNDGRSISSSWQSQEVLNSILMKEAGVQSNWEYRAFLMNNADGIKKKNLEMACNDVGYVVRNENGFEPMDKKSPLITMSDLKSNYLTREQLYAKRVIPSMTQEQVIKQWGQMKKV